MSDEQFIDLIRQYPALYNVKHKQYRDINIKNEAWEQISRITNKSIDECKSMWTKLRNCYNNAIKRRSKKSGQAAKKIIPWRYEEQMSFLFPFLEGRDTWGNLEGSQGEYNSLESEIDIINQESPAAITSPSPIPSPLSNMRTSTPSNSRKSNKRQNQSDSQMTEMLELMKNTQNNRNKRNEMDDTDYFFLSMSHMLKKLPKLDQSKIKMEIHKSIHEAELKQLEKNETTHSKPIKILSQATLPPDHRHARNYRNLPYTIPNVDITNSQMRHSDGEIQQPILQYQSENSSNYIPFTRSQHARQYQLGSSSNDSTPFIMQQSTEPYQPGPSSHHAPFIMVQLDKSNSHLPNFSTTNASNMPAQGFYETAKFDEIL